jgi:inner membrane protein
MLLFAHAGITLGAASVLAGGVKQEWNPAEWFVTLSRYLDIRYLLIGSLLPDIIDKPVGQLLFRDTFGNGRIFSHALLFLIVISAFGLYLWKKQHQQWMLALAAGTFMHLILDGMWETPATLFWPFMGWEFPKIQLENWTQGILHTLVSNPSVYIPEIIGLGILVWFAAVVIMHKKTGVFIRHGRIS